MPPERSRSLLPRLQSDEIRFFSVFFFEIFEIFIVLNLKYRKNEVY